MNQVDGNPVYIIHVKNTIQQIHDESNKSTTVEIKCNIYDYNGNPIYTETTTKNINVSCNTQIDNCHSFTIAFGLVQAIKYDIRNIDVYVTNNILKQYTTNTNTLTDTEKNTYDSLKHTSINKLYSHFDYINIQFTMNHEITLDVIHTTDDIIPSLTPQ